MNSVSLIGRLTRDPEVRYTPSQMAVASFTIAIDRPVRSGEDKKTDFPRITVFGKQAENCEKYLVKGRLVGVQGRIQTGSYQNKDGVTVNRWTSTAFLASSAAPNEAGYLTVKTIRALGMTSIDTQARI